MTEILENNANSGAELFERLISCLQNEEDRAASVKSIPVRSARDAGVLIPVCAALGINAQFEAEELPEPEFSAIAACLSPHGVRVLRSENIVSCSGQLKPGYYPVPKDAPDIFAGGLLIALSQLSGFSFVSLMGPFAPHPEADAAEKLLAASGVRIEKKGSSYIVPPKKEQ